MPKTQHSDVYVGSRAVMHLRRLCESQEGEYILLSIYIHVRIWYQSDNMTGVRSRSDAFAGRGVNTRGVPHELFVISKRPRTVINSEIPNDVLIILAHPCAFK